MNDILTHILYSNCAVHKFYLKEITYDGTSCLEGQGLGECVIDDDLRVSTIC